MGPSFRGQGRRDSALSGTNLKVVKEMGERVEFLQCLIIWEDARDTGSLYRVEPNIILEMYCKTKNSSKHLRYQLNNDELF
jgi:hypothetical protein